MRKIINEIKDWIEDRLRRICAPMGPGTRILVILILCGVFAVVNFYIMFRAIYNIGREDRKWELIDSPIEIPDFKLQDEVPDSLQLEMEHFFYEHFNSEKNDTTAKG